MRLKADLTLLLVSIIWGSAFVAQRIAGQLGSVYVFNGARYLLAALVVSPFAMQAGRVVGDPAAGGLQVFGCILIFIAVLLSQFKERSLRGKIDSTHLVEGR